MSNFLFKISNNIQNMLDILRIKQPYNKNRFKTAYFKHYLVLPQLCYNCCYNQQYYPNIYIYIYIYGAFNKFPDIFIKTFKIVVDSLKFTTLLLYIL